MGPYKFNSLPTPGGVHLNKLKYATFYSIIPPGKTPHYAFLMHSPYMPIHLYISRFIMHSAGYDSVHFSLNYPAKNGPTGMPWGLTP